MSANLIRPTTERTTIAGPAGGLEALLEIPADADASRVAVICHPHPVYGGTMTNKVVHMLAKAFNERGVPALRFNFRGVGASEGRYDEGEGETQDALAAIDWTLQRWPGAALWAAAVHRFAVSGAELPRCPWLLIQGDHDELVDAGEIQRWVATLASPPQLALLPGVDHFFHGRLNELRAVVLEWLDATGAGS
jgi:uncharacterized protein